MENVSITCAVARKVQLDTLGDQYCQKMSEEEGGRGREKKKEKEKEREDNQYAKRSHLSSTTHREYFVVESLLEYLDGGLDHCGELLARVDFAGAQYLLNLV